jgi:hypothetical protein
LLLRCVRLQMPELGKPLVHLGYLAYLVSAHMNRLVDRREGIEVLKQYKLKKSSKLKIEEVEDSPAPLQPAAAAAPRDRAGAVAPRPYDLLSTERIKTPITKELMVHAIGLKQADAYGYIVGKENDNIKTPHKRVPVALCKILAFPNDKIPGTKVTTCSAGYTMDKVSSLH